MGENNKIFDVYTPVDCNDCSHYWNDSCNGVRNGSQKRCTAFLATKRVDIPLQIKAVRAHLKWLYSMVVLEGILVAILGVIVFG